MRNQGLVVVMPRALQLGCSRSGIQITCLVLKIALFPSNMAASLVTKNWQPQKTLNHLLDIEDSLIHSFDKHVLSLLCARPSDGHWGHTDKSDTSSAREKTNSLTTSSE